MDAELTLRKHRLSTLATMVAHERNLRILPGDAWSASPNSGTLTYPIDQLAKLDYDSATGLMWRAASMVVNGVHQRLPYNAAVDTGLALSKQYGRRVLHPKHLLPLVVRAETARIERITRAQSKNLSSTFLPPLGSKHRTQEAADTLQRAAQEPKALDDWWETAADHVTLAAAGIPRPANPAFAHLAQLESIVQPLVGEKSYDDLLGKLEPLAKTMVDAYLAYKANLPPPPPPAPQQQQQQQQQQSEEQDGQGSGASDPDGDSDSQQQPSAGDEDPEKSDKSDDSQDDKSDDDAGDDTGDSRDDADDQGDDGDADGNQDGDGSEDPSASNGNDPGDAAAIQAALDDLAQELEGEADTPLHVDMINGTVGTRPPAEPSASPEKATWVDYASIMTENIEAVRTILLRYLSETDTADRERGLRSGRVDVKRIGALVNGTSDAVFCRRTLPGDTSVDVVMLLDISASMNMSVDKMPFTLVAQRYHAVRAFLVTFAEALRTIPDARLSVIRWDDYAETMVDLGQVLDPLAQDALMKCIIPRGNTDLNPALIKAGEVLRYSEAGRKLVIVATDGGFGTGLQSTALHAIGDADLSIYTLDCPAEEAHKFIDARQVSRIESTGMGEGIETQFRRIFA